MITINRLLFKETSILPLVAFRIIFASLMLIGSIRFLSYGWVEQLYIQPKFYFGFIKGIVPLSGNWMYVPFLLLLLGSLGVLFGAWYRASAILSFISFTYIELLDKTNYLNHYYFVSLVLFLLIFLPANAYFSVDNYRNRLQSLTTVPVYTIGILKFQLAVVYFFAGIAKINSDWLLHAQPLKIWLQAYRDLPFIGDYFATNWLAFAFSWFGCVYDLTIPFFLLSKKTRSYAYLFVIVFHIVTWLLFPIGIFPWVMIFSTLIFFPDSFHRRWLNQIQTLFRPLNICTETKTLKWFSKKVVFLCLIFYVTIQLALPLRCFFGNSSTLFWHEEGMRFSWRVMLMHKEGYATFYVKDARTNREIQVRNEDFLTENQVDQMSTQPDMIKQFADYLYRVYNDSVIHTNQEDFRISSPSIHAQVYVSLNGRPSQLFISKTHALQEKKYTFAPHKWLAPFNPAW